MLSHNIDKVRHDARKAVTITTHQGEREHKRGSSLHRSSSATRSSVSPGLIGLTNYGSSCYLNSIIQCLAHIDTLAEFFCTDNHHAQNASENGEDPRPRHLTENFCVFVKIIWCLDQRHSSLQALQLLRGSCSLYRKPFAECEQQDAQEFLQFMLEALHEELNVGRKQRYRTKAQSLSRSPANVIDANERQNRSIIYDLFSGYQLASIQCPQCGHTATNVDPFSCLSLSIPSLQQKQPLLIVRVDLHNRHTRYGFLVSANDDIGMLKEMLAKSWSLGATDFVLIDLRADGIHHTYKDDELLSAVVGETVGAVSLYCIEMPPRGESPSLTQDDSGAASITTSSEDVFVRVIVAHVEVSDEFSAYGIFSGPYTFEVPIEISFQELLDLSLNHLSDYLELTLSRAFLRLCFRVVDGAAGATRLTSELDVPLMTRTVRRALNFNESCSGVRHLKLLVEWPSDLKNRLLGATSWQSQSEVSVDASVHHVMRSPDVRSSLEERNTTLTDCLDQLISKQRLGEDDAWLCPRCRRGQRATMTSSLCRCPDVLALHLKRFRSYENYGKSNKISVTVDFPLTGLSIAPYVMADGNTDEYNPDEYTYDLICVCNHYGTLQNGHYTSFCYSVLDMRWWCFNDEKLYVMESSDICTNAAYILFYQRRSTLNRVKAMVKGGSLDGDGNVSTKHWIYGLVPRHARISLLSHRSDSQRESVVSKPSLNGKHAEKSKRSSSPEKSKRSSSPSKSHSLPPAEVVVKPPNHPSANVHASTSVPSKVPNNSVSAEYLPSKNPSTNMHTGIMAASNVRNNSMSTNSPPVELQSPVLTSRIGRPPTKPLTGVGLAAVAAATLKPKSATRPVPSSKRVAARLARATTAPSQDEPQEANGGVVGAAERTDGANPRYNIRSNAAWQADNDALPPTGANRYRDTNMAGYRDINAAGYRDPNVASYRDANVAGQRISYPPGVGNTSNLGGRAGVPIVSDEDHCKTLYFNHATIRVPKVRKTAPRSDAHVNEGHWVYKGGKKVWVGSGTPPL